MNEDRLDHYCYLDKVRMTDGTDHCKAVFYEACTNNKHKAAALLNDQRMTYPCLFILLPQIKYLRIYPYLSRRNTAAAGITDQISNPRGPNKGIDYLSGRKDMVHPVLRWMLETGSAEDGPDDDYEQILDITASVLLDTYQDKSILPIVCDMIFERSKKGHNIHDLVWAFFRTHDPHALQLVAGYLDSSDQEVAGLAHRLLHIEMDAAAANQNKSESYLGWLSDNDPFLYFTGESLQFSSKPMVYKVDAERKYMQKGIPAYTKQPIAPSNSGEKECLEAFRSLARGEKIMLSEHSHKIRRKDVTEWDRWMAFPVEEQIRAVKAGAEGMR